MRISKTGAVVPLLLAGGLLVAACGSSSSSSTTTTSGASTAATVSVATFNKSFTTMANLKSVTAAGKGKIAVILPDTVSSARYTEFDAPYLAKAFATAGLSTSDTIIQNAQGSDSTQLTDAQSDITSGATVLVVDPLDSGVGTSIETYATAHGVPVVDYDRLVLGGSRKYYVSFDNVKVGTLIGKGMVSCIAAWKVAKPVLAVMVGAPTDNNATLVGLQNIISGYQCGTAYKPIFLEAQAAASLALYLRAGLKPPASLVNGSVKDTTENVSVPSSLLIPEWVTPTNMETTVIADNFVPASQLCAGAYATDCTTYGIH